MASENNPPGDIFHLKGKLFYEFVQSEYGNEMMELLRVQGVSSAHSLLHTKSDLFDFLRMDTVDPASVALKHKVAFLLSDGTWQIKVGIQDQADNFTNALRICASTPGSTQPSPSKDLVISANILQNFPWLEDLVLFCRNSLRPSTTRELTFLCKFVENLAKNLSNPSNRYRYLKLVDDFAMALFIAGGHYAYEFVRLNMPGSLPSPTSISSRLAIGNHRLTEGEFRFDALQEYLTTIDVHFVFLSEDCTGVIKKVSYDAKSNSFVGFSPPLDRDGLPRQCHYRTNSFNQLKQWFVEEARSSLLNIHVVQPITVGGRHDPSYLLSAYGTDNKFDMRHVLLRWLHMIEECRRRGNRIIGISTDCDGRYLRAMRLITGFFATLPNIPIRDDPDAFRVTVPLRWNWFFFHSVQKCLVFQVSDISIIITSTDRRIGTIKI